MAPTPVNQSSLWRLLGLIAPRRTQYILSLIGRVLISTTERLFVAYAVKLFVDAMMSQNMGLLESTVLLMVFFYLGYMLVAPPVFYAWRSAIYHGTANIREVIFKHLLKLPLGYHELHHSGDALSVLTNDVSAAEQAYQQDLYTLVEASAQGLSAAIFMMALNWKLALVIILSGLVPLIVNTLFAGPLRKVGQVVQASLGGLSEGMTDLLAGFQVVRTFHLGDWILGRFENANDRVLENSLRRVRLEAALASANDFAGMSFFLSMMFGAYLAMTGQTTFGIMIALVQLNNQIAYFVFSLGGTISRIQSALAAADRIFKLLDEAPEPESYPLKPEILPLLPASKDHKLIQFQNISFGYESGQNVLKGVSLDVQSGQMVAFAGPSGGGKSTLFKLLLGCYPVVEGGIYVKDRWLNEYNLSDLRQLFAYVPQDSYLFSGTILDNIRYGKLEATEEEIIEACKAAFAHDFVMELPLGYQTLVGERGARLSGGQRQRIAIARALLKDAPILLLDEATSSLDSESEQEVQKALEVLMSGRTTLLIAHRFSTIVNADVIYVIEDGRVAEQGKHEDLMAMDGVYANLYRLQFKMNAEAPDALQVA